MIEKKDKYLPIGSVVILKGAKRKLMITGYIQIDLKKLDKVYDYSGCLFPEGIINTDKSLLFNHDQIEKIFFVGYMNEEEKEFQQKLKETVTEENIKRMIENVKKQVSGESL